MKKKSRSKPDALAGSALALALFATACVGTEPIPSSTTVTTSTTQPPSTTAIPDPCPEPFCVVYSIRPEATWSDGVPVTAADFIHTYEAQVDRNGYELVSRAEAMDDKTVLFAFSEAYGPWQTLFDVVLPAHVDDPLSVSAGPFVVSSTGEEIVLVRNPEYPAAGDVEEVRFVAVAGVRDGLGKLEVGELDVFEPPPLIWVVDELNQMDGVRHYTVSGPVWEQIAFNYDNPLLSEKWMREAINLAIDREAILDATLRTVDSDEVALNSAIWPDAASVYEPAFPEGWNPERAVEILTDQGCVRGEDGVFTCGAERLQFTYATTVGDPWRRAHFDIAREHLAQIGIELDGAFLAPAELFSEDFFFGSSEMWDLIGFPWMFGEALHLSNGRFTCNPSTSNGYGALNVGHYCNIEVDRLVTQSSTAVSPRAIRDVYRQIDQLYLGDIAVIPLYQRPMTVGFNDAIVGLHPNMSSSTLVWNIGEWTGDTEVRIGIEFVPVSLDVLDPGDAALVLAPVTAGAFSVDPSFRFVAMLIDSAETIVSEP